MLEDEPTEDIVEVLVYGLQRKERVKRLIDELARVPCIPEAIYRADRMGRLLAVTDALRKGRKDSTVYVRVVQWDPDLIAEWTLCPRAFHPRLKSQTTKAVRRFTTTLRLVPMKQKMDLIRHARLTKDACKS